jgi:hypothetical protein
VSGQHTSNWWSPKKERARGAVSALVRARPRATTVDRPLRVRAPFLGRTDGHMESGRTHTVASVDVSEFLKAWNSAFSRPGAFRDNQEARHSSGRRQFLSPTCSGAGHREKTAPIP